MYISTKQHVYFDLAANFKGNKSVLLTSKAKTNDSLYFDNSYNKVVTFNGPFLIQVFPYLHINRISMMGLHHELSPIFYQHKSHYVYMLN